MAEVDNSNKDKFIKFKGDKWSEHRTNADILAAERGRSNLAIAEYLNEAAKFFETNRTKA